MYCNQPFNGNSFSNMPSYGYNVYNPPSPSSIYSEIVGEGEVTSVTLPDGSFQLFFLPTVKWWRPQAASTCPYYTNVVNANSPYCGANTGAWFVRTIINPTPPVFTNPTCPQYEAALPFYSDGNLNPYNGYQLKFHNDRSTSTSDIHYFFPCLRQLDCSLALPTRGCAAVQVNTPPTNNTVCHYEFTCSKPCHCTPKQSKDPAACQSESVMSMEDMKTGADDVICECDDKSFGKTKKSNKRGEKFRGIDRSSSKDVFCECGSPFSSKCNRTKLKSGSYDKTCTLPLRSTTPNKARHRSAISLSEAGTNSSKIVCKCDDKLNISLVKPKRKCVCCVRDPKCKNVRTTSGKVICVCAKSLAKRKYECKCGCNTCNSKDTKASKVISECAQVLAKRKAKCNCECSTCASKDTKTRKVICDCAEPLAKRKRKCNCGCSTCNPKDSKSSEIICECGHVLATEKSKCNCGCSTYDIGSDEVLCECTKLLGKRKSKCTCGCSTCDANDTKTRKVLCECAKRKRKCNCGCSTCNPKDTKSSEVICECAQVLAKQKAKCNCGCSTCNPKDTKSSEVICECAQVLAKQKAKCNCGCSTCNPKDTKSSEVICECAQVLAKQKAKCNCGCSTCNPKDPKSSEVICECAQVLAKQKAKCNCGCSTCNPKDTKSSEVICECAQVLAKQKAKCNCGCSTCDTSGNKVICECAQVLAKRKSKCNCGCSTCNMGSGEVHCECPKALGNRKSKCKCGCSTCASKDTYNKKVICECAKVLAKPKSKCNCGCSTCNIGSGEVLCECSKALGKRKSKCKCGCSICDFKGAKEVICECAQYLTKRNRCKCGRPMCNPNYTKSSEIIWKCAQLAKRCNLKRKYDCINDSEDTKSRSKEVIYECRSSSFNKSNKSKAKSVCCVRRSDDIIQLQLLPTDGGRKRIRLDRRPQRADISQSKDVICECDPPPCSNKSMATYTDQSCGGNPCMNVETQSCCDQGTIVKTAKELLYRCNAQPEVWRPATATSRKKFESQCNEKYSDSSSSRSSSSHRDTDEGKNE